MSQIFRFKGGYPLRIFVLGCAYPQFLFLIFALELGLLANLPLELSLLKTTLNHGIQIALDALLNQRLALLCGAGLSMASPSDLPSAAHLAAEAKRKYEATYGTTRLPLPSTIDQQAEFFFSRGELGSVYLRTLIDFHAFAGEPNAGHKAVADLLLVRGIQLAVSTNVDTLIENAGSRLFGQIGAGLDRNSLARLRPDTAPLLKIHGCWQQDRENTVWATGQLSEEPVASRISSSREWLSTHLLDRDLIIVGYFTDWDYLNGVLETTLGEVRPARVVVVDPSNGAWLATKAPALYALGSRARVEFYHVDHSGDEFLDLLRRDFSRSFIRTVFHSGSDTYHDATGATANPDWLEPALTDTDALWRMRRDLEGCYPNKPAQAQAPPNEPLLGLTLLQLQAHGAVVDGQYWLLGRKRVRVIRTPNQLLHKVVFAFERETAPAVAPDTVIAVGAENLGLPAHIIRTGTSPTIARGSASQWLTYNEAVSGLGL